MMALEKLKFMAVNIESLSKNYWILLATMAKSDIVKELFEDGGTGNPETDVTNQTGIYVTKVRLNRDIPELLPVAGRRIRISYLVGIINWRIINVYRSFAPQHGISQRDKFKRYFGLQNVKLKLSSSW